MPRKPAYDSASLLSLTIPPMAADQVSLVTKDSLQAHGVGHFSPSKTLTSLHASKGKTVIAADLGGSSLAAAQYVSNGDSVECVSEIRTDTSPSGSHYLAFFEDLAREAAAAHIPVGLSIAGPLTGTRLMENVNSPAFAQDLARHYGSDFANLFDHFTIDNDAIAGLKAGALAALRKWPNIKNVLYIINGSGLGGALLHGDEIIQMEPGHIAAVPALNPFHQTTPCGQHGKQHVCLERIVSGKMGIEDLYLTITGTHKTGEQISQSYVQGDTLARDLYNWSAIGTAHIIKGIGDAYDLFATPDHTALVCHGGVFHVPGYGARLEQILRNYIPTPFPLLYTHTISANACLDGAAIAALILPDL